MQYNKANSRVDKSLSPFLANIYYDKTCIVCGDSFKSGRPHGKYCSQRCINDAYILRRRKRTDEKRDKASLCIVCHTPITQNIGKIKQYCSNACKQKAYRMRKIGKALKQ